MPDPAAIPAGDSGRGMPANTTSPDNHASQHVLRKCGLVFDRFVTMEDASQWLFRTRALPVPPPRA